MFPEGAPQFDEDLVNQEKARILNKLENTPAMTQTIENAREISSDVTVDVDNPDLQIAFIPNPDGAGFLAILNDGVNQETLNQKELVRKYHTHKKFMARLTQAARHNSLQQKH